MLSEERIAQLRTAFERVQNKEHWKGPISAVVKGEELVDVTEAIMFYTATPTTVRPMGGNEFEIESVGYWAGPAGA